MKTIARRFIIALLSLTTVAAAPADKLPEMIREKEKGVFFLRVLNKEGQLISSGTAFLVDGKGTLVTALHVILPNRDVAGSVEALDADGKTWKVAGVSANDESVDLALLKLTEVPASARPLALAGDKLPEQGSKVLVLGHPQGFQFVATDGIVSATHKTDQLPERFRQSGLVHSDPAVVWIQTTAAVSNGNSGGPLLDESGKVIGIVQWMTHGQSMNFALQVASIRKLLGRPGKLQTLQAFIEPQAEFNALKEELARDHMRFQQKSFTPFGFPGEKRPKPEAEKNPLLIKYVPALLALATKHRDKDVELPILLMLMNLAEEDDCPSDLGGDVKKASDRLLEKFRDDRRLLSFLWSQPKPSLPELRQFLGALSKASADAEIRALAALMSAHCIDANGNDGESLKTAMEYARAAAACPPGIMVGPESVAGIAEQLIDKLEHAVAGCAAPELTGIDQDGKSVKLSNLKGHHVVLAFYTAENEFKTGVSRQLNELVKYGEGRPLSVMGILFEEPNHFFSGSGYREVKKTWASLKDDADGALRKAWHITDAPTVFLIDSKGVIIGRFTDPPGEEGMGFGALFGGGLFGPGPGASQWMQDLLGKLKDIPELESEAERQAKIPNRLAAIPTGPSILKGLTLRYSFDKKEVGTIRDSSGKAHHAKTMGGEWTDDPRIGGCYKMAKPGDQIVALDYKGVMGAKPRTAAFWFKNEKTPKGQSCSLVRWGRDVPGEVFDLKVEGAVFNANTCHGGRVSKISSDVLLDGKWHHVAVTLPDGGKLADLVIYIDGAPAEMGFVFGRNKYRQRLENNPLNTIPGLLVTIGSEKVTGFFDEVMIWERTLDAGEIARLYKATGGQKLDPAMEARLMSNALSTEGKLAAEKVVPVQDKPDFDNPETLEKILAGAVMMDALEKRGPEGAELFYSPGSKTPYTGWSKKLHGNRKVALLGALKDGEPAGLWTWWDENGLKEDEKRHAATTL